MFELMVLTYVMMHLIYVIYAKRQVEKKVDQEDLLYVLGHLIVGKLLRRVKDKCLSSEEQLRLNQLYGPKKLEKGKHKYLSRKVGLIYLVLALGGFFAIILGEDYREGSLLTTSIERPAYGEEALALEVEVALDQSTMKQSMPLVIQAKVPKGDEAQEVLEEHFFIMVTTMLGDTNLQNQVIEDLNFSRSPFEAPISVSYESLTPEYLTDKGELRINEMDLNSSYEASVLVTMTLSDRQIENVYEFELLRVPMSLEEEFDLLGQRIDIQEGHVILPDSLMERATTLTWRERVAGMRGSQVLALTLILSVLIFVFRKEELNRALEERRLLILIDFPDVVIKLTMLINAGMTLSRAWHKVVMDYQEHQLSQRPLYDEMLVTTIQIQNGMPEREALENFGRRTGTKEVMRMTAILIQNLKRGNHSLTEALKQLSIEAWEIRTSSARVLGEKASTKLLLPMGISFVTVIIIVLAPTLMSMQL